MKKIWHKLTGGIVWLLFVVVGLFRAKPEQQRMVRMDYSTNARKMRVRVTEKIRNNWRRRWLKLKR